MLMVMRGLKLLPIAKLYSVSARGVPRRAPASSSLNYATVVGRRFRTPNPTTQ